MAINRYSKSPEHRLKLSLANKGKHLTEETKRKISIANKGQTRNEETKAKMSIAQKGKVFSVVTRQKLSLAHIGKKATDEVKKKMSIDRIGKKHKKKHPSRTMPMETRLKISNTQKGKPSPLKGKHISEEHRKNISLSKMGEKNPFFGKHHTEEHKLKLSIAGKGNQNALGYHPSEETRKKLIAAHLGKHTAKLGTHVSEEVKAINKATNIRLWKESKQNNIPRGMTGQHHTDETKKVISAKGKGKSPWIKGKHHTEETKRKISSTNKTNIKVLNNLTNLRTRIQRISEPQKEMFYYLKILFPDAKLEHLVKTKETWRFIDVAIPSQHLAFEYDGTYWHNKRPEDDIRRNKELSEIGWKTIRLNKEKLKALVYSEYELAFAFTADQRSVINKTKIGNALINVLTSNHAEAVTPLKVIKPNTDSEMPSKRTLIVQKIKGKKQIVQIAIPQMAASPDLFLTKRFRNFLNTPRTPQPSKYHTDA